MTTAFRTHWCVSGVGQETLTRTRNAAINEARRHVSEADSGRVYVFAIGDRGQHLRFIVTKKGAKQFNPLTYRPRARKAVMA